MLPPGLFEPAEFPAIDFGMWLRMALDWDMAFLADTLGQYRIHGASHSSAPGLGEPLRDGYVQGFDLVDALLALKLRFLARNGDRLERRDELARLARRRVGPA